MEIDDLRAFVEVADAGGVTSAARRLGLAKSMVSRRVMRLEESLGVQLIARNTRGATLTEAGITFRDHAAHVIATLDSAREDMSPTGELRGLLRVAAAASFGPHIAPMIVELAARHPALHVHTSFNDRYVDLVAEGYDCGVRVGYLPDSNLIARKIGTMRGRIWASPTYIERHGVPKVPDDIVNHSAITPGADIWNLSNGKKTYTVRPQGRFKADSASTLAEAAAASIGITALCEIFAEPFASEGKLVPIMTDYELPPVGIYIVWPPGQHLPRKVRVLIDLLVEQFSGNKGLGRYAY